MRVVLHARSDAPVFTALAAGCQVAGHSVAWQRPSLWHPSDVDAKADVAVVFGVTGHAGRILATYRARGTEVWILDFPRLRHFADETALFRNTFDWLPETGRPVTLPTLAAHTPETTLVIGQKPGDASHGMDAAAMHAWLRETVTYARSQSDRPVVVRWHPQDRSKRPADAWGADAVSDPATEPLSDALARAAVVVTYNSTVGWDAIAAGVPVAARSTHPVAYSAYATDVLDAPAILPKAKRAEALRRARASQWPLDALRDGSAVRAMTGAH